MGDTKNVKKNVSDVSAKVEKKPKAKTTTKKTQATSKTVAPKKAQTQPKEITTKKEQKQPKEITTKKEVKIESKKENITVGKEIRTQKNVCNDNDAMGSIVKVVLGIVLVVFIGILVFKACDKPVEEYVVTFDSNGGTRITDVVVKEDGKLEKPEEPTREGYIFDGWYYNDKLYDFDTPVTEDIQLEAKWVKAVSVTGVSLNKTSIKLDAGETTTLKATIKPKDASNKSLIWKSSNPKVATVDKNGKVEAIKEGKTTITVKTEDGEFTAKVKVTVIAVKEDVAVTGVRVNKEVVTVKVGKITKVTAYVLPTNATNKKVTWGSSNPSVAKVSSTGVITGVKEGTATITVKTSDGEYTKTVTVKVIPTVKAENITIEGDSVGLEGDTTTLTAIITPANTDDKTVTWKSSNEEVATVSSQGVVTFKKAGKTTITATTSNGKKATHEITVKEKYTIIFKSDNNQVASYKVAEGTKVVDLINRLSTIAKEDYELVGWESENGIMVDDTTTVSSDIVYNAKWKATFVVVTNQTELENALTSEYKKIVLGNDIEVDKSIVVLRDVVIDGSEEQYSIKKSGNPSYVSGGDNYVIKVYGVDSIDVTFKNIKLTNAMGAMLVGDNAIVTVDNVDIDGNVWGGIEVKDTETTNLIVESVTHTDEEYLHPTVWVDNEIVENANITFEGSTVVEITKANGSKQVQYYTSEVTATTITVTNEAELLEALANTNIKTIELGAEIVLENGSVNIQRNIVIDGGENNYSIKMKEVPTYTAGGDNYVVKVYGAESINVVIKNTKLTNSLGAMMVGDNATVTVDNVDVDGNVWGGIEVKDTETTALIVTSIIHTEETSTKPTVWVDNTTVENATITSTNLTQQYVESKNQVFYYLNNANMVLSINSTEVSENNNLSESLNSNDENEETIEVSESTEEVTDENMELENLELSNNDVEESEDLQVEVESSTLNENEINVDEVITENLTEEETPTTSLIESDVKLETESTEE